MHNSEASAGVIPAPLLDLGRVFNLFRGQGRSQKRVLRRIARGVLEFFEHFFANLSKGQSGRLSGRKRLCLAKESVLQTRADWLSRTLALA